MTDLPTATSSMPSETWIAATRTWLSEQFGKCRRLTFDSGGFEPIIAATRSAAKWLPKTPGLWRNVGVWSPILFSIMANLLLLTGPIFMLQIYDRVLASGSVPTLMALGALVAMLYGFYGLMEALRARIMIQLGSLLDRKLAAWSFSRATLAGPHDAARRCPSDLNKLRQFLSGPGMINLFDIPWMPIYLAVVFLLHPLLGVTATLAGLLLVTLTVLRGYWLARPIADAMAADQRAHGVASQAQRQVESLVAMGMINPVRDRWQDHHQAALDAGQLAGDGVATATALSKMLRLAAQSLILGVGAYLAIHQEISAGAMIAASIIFSRAFAPIEQLAGSWRPLNEALVAWRRLRSVIAEHEPPTAGAILPLPEEQLVVDQLDVAPPGAASPTIKGISFVLKAGEGLGIIGQSGCGKTSLARTLIGAWAPMAGGLRLDGASLDQWPADQRGRFIGYLSQDIELFDGTVAENIARLQKSAAEADVLAAARLASIHSMIVGMPRGYETMIGPSHAPLSAGQRQLIGLARAVFGHPFLVLLDEPNANLDSAGDRALQMAIRRLRAQGSIVIVIAHRPSAIAEVNMLLWLADGGQRMVGPKEMVVSRLTSERQKQAGGLHVVGR